MANGADHWFHQRHARDLKGPIAYFCAEYGLHESMGIYSGGLGVLAGDHMKAASDMALPLVGVGLLYRNGYFRQTIDADGHQEHRYPDYDLARMPLTRALGREGNPLTVSVELPERSVHVDVWTVQVGRVPVLLLDTDNPINDPADRPITHILYVRGREMRLHQELILGVGGVRALRALGIKPDVWHLNEGHSAFLLAERARERIVAGDDVDTALATVARNSVFTIHTPVSAGNERFDADLVRRVAGPLLDGDGRRNTGGVPVERVLEIGRGTDGDAGQFDMTAFSLRLTNGANAVSKLHAATANSTWREIPPHGIIGDHQRGPPTDVGRRADPRPVTSGTSTPTSTTSTAPRTRSRWWERIDRVTAEGPVGGAPRPEARARACSRAAASGTSSPGTARRPERSQELGDALDPKVLTIGFARRFATYKRAGMIFTDRDRLARLLGDPDRPVQLVFAGKAHPADRPGQAVIQEIFGRTRSPEFRGRVFVLEDYDMRIAQVPRPGRRRLAEQSPAPARGLGHLGDEGRDEWRRQPVASSTAGGTRAGATATAGRSAVASRSRTRPPRTGPTRWTCTGCSRARSCPSTTSATRRAFRPAGSSGCGGRSRRCCGSSRPRGCSTSTRSGCTCRPRASTSPEAASRRGRDGRTDEAAGDEAGEVEVPQG